MVDWGAVLKPTAKRVIETLLPGPRTLSALAEATSMAKPSLLRHLRLLEEAGILTKEEVRTSVGREMQYHLNEMSLHLETRPGSGAIVSWAASGHHDETVPLASQIADPRRRSDVTAALGGIRRRYGQGFDEDVSFILLFGSYARGEATWKSDIDLMALLRSDAGEVREALRDAVAGAQEDVENPIRMHVSTVRDFVEGRKRLEKEAAEDGLVLHGRHEEGGVWRKLRRYKSISF